MSCFSAVVKAGLDPAIQPRTDVAIFSMMDARVEPAHDVALRGEILTHHVIPGRASSREPGIHNPWTQCGRPALNGGRWAYGFRVCTLRAHPGMTNESLFGATQTVASRHRRSPHHDR
jgi:hypothetical protein